MSENPILDVSDTARWAAVFRARESKRRDRLFRDDFAAMLVGTLPEEDPGEVRASWIIAVRTVVIDGLIMEAVTTGADTVLSLGAGLDTRPYRLELPSKLRWVEVDYPHVIRHKDERLAGHTP
jgi:methyltransferase (TIGR00027 family)